MRAYLAGPDVFLPNAVAHARAKIALCARYGIEGLAPINEDLALAGLSEEAAWRAIYAKDVALMEAADLVIANLTPFRGASADAGTLVELGWFLGRGKPIHGYSNSAAPFAVRSRAFPDGMLVEGFGLADNLMIVGAIAQSGGQLHLPAVELAFDALQTFEACVAAIAPPPLAQQQQASG